MTQRLIYAALFLSSCASAPEQTPDAPKVEAPALSFVLPTAAPAEMNTAQKQQRFARLMRESSLGLLDVHNSEMESLVAELAGVTPPPKTREDAEKLQSAMSDALKAHDPQLAEILKTNIERFSCQAKQTGAKMKLKSLWVAQESYRAEFDKYAGDLETLEFSAPPDVEMTLTVSDEGFVASARSSSGDEFRIDQRGELEVVVDSCGGRVVLQPTEEDRASLRGYFRASLLKDLASKTLAGHKLRASITRGCFLGDPSEDELNLDELANEMSRLSRGLLTDDEHRRWLPLEAKQACLVRRGDITRVLANAFVEGMNVYAQTGKVPDETKSGDWTFAYKLESLEMELTATNTVTGDVWRRAPNGDVEAVNDCSK